MAGARQISRHSPDPRACAVGGYRGKYTGKSTARKNQHVPCRISPETETASENLGY